jgi:hypothetical protein
MKYKGNINYRINILLILKKNLKEIRNQMQQHCIKKLKKAEEQLEESQNSDKEELKS